MAPGRPTRIDSIQMKKEVPVDRLEFGVFIAELDRPWTETPFMYQGFVLSNEKQLEALKKHCKTVFIDLDKGPDLPERSDLLAGDSDKPAAPKIPNENAPDATLTRVVRRRDRWRRRWARAAGRPTPPRARRTHRPSAAGRRR